MARECKTGGIVVGLQGRWIGLCCGWDGGDDNSISNELWQQGAEEGVTALRPCAALPLWVGNLGVFGNALRERGVGCEGALGTQIGNILRGQSFV
jgi:hypothetical protein